MMEIGAKSGRRDFPGGVWPVMLTPFTERNEVDYPALGRLTDWYLEGGCSGLFAVTQSSEMFFLTPGERIEIARYVIERVAGRVPVIAGGHVSDSLEDQILEVNRMSGTGADAVILTTNRLAAREEGDEVWIANMKRLLDNIPRETKLGLYECPYPYKRVLSRRLTEWCADCGRFYFLKDTSCDLENIRMKLSLCSGSNLRLYNANTATLLASLREGAAGYSGVMANMQIRLYDLLTREFEREEMKELSDALTMCALIEKQWYPTNAKYYLQLEGMRMGLSCRVQDAGAMTGTQKDEVAMLRRITGRLENRFLREVGHERNG